MGSPRIHPETRIGCVTLKAANIERSERRYRDPMNLEMTQRHGEDAASLSAGGYHRHSAPNTRSDLFRLAVLYPERRELARTFGMLLDLECPLDGAFDHGVFGVSDPDDGVELHLDRPGEAWIHYGEGDRALVTQPLDARGLLAEFDGAACGG